MADMDSIFCRIDDKHIPMFRIVWVADTPHFCGEEDCQREGFYEVRLEQAESVWATRDERDRVIQSMNDWSQLDGGDESW